MFLFLIWTKVKVWLIQWWNIFKLTSAEEDAAGSFPSAHIKDFQIRKSGSVAPLTVKKSRSLMEFLRQKILPSVIRDRDFWKERAFWSSRQRQKQIPWVTLRLDIFRLGTQFNLLSVRGISFFRNVTGHSWAQLTCLLLTLGRRVWPHPQTHPPQLDI